MSDSISSRTLPNPSELSEAGADARRRGVSALGAGLSKPSPVSVATIKACGLAWKKHYIHSTLKTTLTHVLGSNGLGISYLFLLITVVK